MELEDSGTYMILDALQDKGGEINAKAKAFAEKLFRINRIYTCGNGGSASQASHMTAELVGRFEVERPSLYSFCLNSDTSCLTAVANDYGYNNVFSRYGNIISHDDAIIIFSTSGNSENLVELCKNLKTNNIFGVLGKGGGEIKNYCLDYFDGGDYSTATIQEMHLIFLHQTCRLLEGYHFKN